MAENVQKEKGLIEFVERKRDWHGRFGTYVYRVLHVVAATARKGAEQASNHKGRRIKKHSTTGQGVLWPLIAGNPVSEKTSSTAFCSVVGPRDQARLCLGVLSSLVEAALYLDSEPRVCTGDNAA
jgi:hypothetical protein